MAFLIPLKGWSNLSIQGGPLCELETDKAFNDELKMHLKPEIEVKEFDLELNSAEFALAAVEALINMMKGRAL